MKDRQPTRDEVYEIAVGVVCDQGDIPLSADQVGQQTEARLYKQGFGRQRVPKDWLLPRLRQDTRVCVEGEDVWWRRQHA